MYCIYELITAIGITQNKINYFHQFSRKTSNVETEWFIRALLLFKCEIISSLFVPESDYHEQRLPPPVYILVYYLKEVMAASSYTHVNASSANTLHLHAIYNLRHWMAALSRAEVAIQEIAKKQEAKCNLWNHCVYGLYLSSGILNNRKTLYLGSWICFRTQTKGGCDIYSLGFLRKG
jgi:hypothetical protein